MNKILKKTTVLIAEDDRFNRLLLISMLTKNKQIKVLEAKNGEEALEMLSTHNIDILLLDIYMPKMDGLATLKKIRQMKRVANIPIMVISSDETEMKKSLEFGANAFIAKPFKIKELEGQIYTLLGEQHKS
jgi:two-component system chemotaxis sensor kinase CheA